MVDVRALLRNQPVESLIWIVSTLTVIALLVQLVEVADRVAQGKSVQGVPFWLFALYPVTCITGTAFAWLDGRWEVLHLYAIATLIGVAIAVSLIAGMFRDLYTPFMPRPATIAVFAALTTATIAVTVAASRAWKRGNRTFLTVLSTVGGVVLLAGLAMIPVHIFQRGNFGVSPLFLFLVTAADVALFAYGIVSKNAPVMGMIVPALACKVAAIAGYIRNQTERTGKHDPDTSDAYWIGSAVASVVASAGLATGIVVASRREKRK